MYLIFLCVDCSLTHDALVVGSIDFLKGVTGIRDNSRHDLNESRMCSECAGNVDS
jgi:hypothetical protein